MERTQTQTLTDARRAERARRYRIMFEQDAAGYPLCQDDYEWATLTGIYANWPDEPPQGDDDANGSTSSAA